MSHTTPIEAYGLIVEPVVLSVNSKVHNNSMSSAVSEHAVSYAVGVETVKPIK